MDSITKKTSPVTQNEPVICKPFPIRVEQFNSLLLTIATIHRIQIKIKG
jgi:hypothetical protein